MEQKYKTRTGPVKLMQASAAARQSITYAGDTDFYVRPMMLNAWTQTTSDDFAYLKQQQDPYSQETVSPGESPPSHVEKDLLDKIRVLEESLRAHSEILAQIHSTSSRTSLVDTRSPFELPRSGEGATYNSTPLNAATTAIINPLPQNPNEGSVKYRIIADGGSDDAGVPIEIQLSEEDSINLNTSTDSNRLEICLNDSLGDGMKTEKAAKAVAAASQDYSTPSAHFIKRRKLSGISADQNQENSYGSGSNNSLNDSSLTPLHNNNNNNSNSQPRQRKDASVRRDSMKTPKIEYDNVMVSIGPNNTRIQAKIYENMSWNTASLATRKLLMSVFDRETLATHSMTGKPSPAFKDHGKPLKQQLDPKVIQDIIFAVTRKCNVSEKEVRNAITTKCADENKMMKLQMNKMNNSRVLKEQNNKENVV